LKRFKGEKKMIMIPHTVIEEGYGEITPYIDIEKSFNVEVVTIKLKCKKCGHEWGVKIDEYNSILDVPERKFKCMECGD
jgi:hypothetical protein